MLLNKLIVAQVQDLVYPEGHLFAGEAKGLRTILQERGMWQDGMLKAEAATTLAECPDFKHEKTELEKLVSNFATSSQVQHSVLFLPKFHCEFNPIELAWAKSKIYTRQHCGYSIVALRKLVPIALDRYVALQHYTSHFFVV